MDDLSGNPLDLSGAPERPQFCNKGKGWRAQIAIFAMPAIFIVIGLFSFVRLYFDADLPPWLTGAVRQFGWMDQRRATIAVVTGFLALAVTGMLTSRINNSQPSLAFTNEGIYAYRREKPWRLLRWTDVSAITRMRPFRRRTQQTIEILRIQGPAFSFILAQYFENYDEARRLLAQYARLRRIKLFDWKGRGSVPTEISDL
ncbi:MAG TPA: hypothetical protein VKS60_06170 [Stellaceae bacterium]|nr:hypothetical protein [Stellaceae bacterium]